MTADSNKIAARNLVCGPEGILKAQFCFKYVAEEQSNGDQEEGRKMASEDMQYEESEHNIPTLLVNNIQDLDKPFNEVSIILKNTLGSIQAYLADETQPNNFTVFLNKSRKDLVMENLDLKVKEFVNAARRFYMLRYQVEMFRENLQLCWDPYGRLKDILKYGQSFNIEVKGQFNPEVVGSLMKPRDRVHILAKKEDGLSIAHVYATNKKTANRLFDELKNNINLDPAKAAYSISSELLQEKLVKKESWFINFSFYDDTYATDFELRFPNEHCFRKAQDLVRDSNEVRIVGSEEIRESFVQSIENKLFYSEAREDKRSDQEGRYNQKSTSNWVMYMKANNEKAKEESSYLSKDEVKQPQPEGRRRYEIKQILDKLMANEVDYALLFTGSAQEAVEMDIFRGSFYEAFSEFKYFQVVKFFTPDGYCTPFVTVVNQNPTSLNDIMYPILEIYKEGKLDDKIRVNNAVSVTPKNFYCFAKMGRIRIEEVQYKVANHFKDLIKQFRKDLRIFPCLIPSESSYRIYIYCCFNESKGLNILNYLSSLLKPCTIKLAISKLLAVEKLEKRARKLIDAEISGNEICTSKIHEDNLIVNVYSTEVEKQKLENLCVTIQKKLKSAIQETEKKIAGEMRPFLDEFSAMPGVIEDKQNQSITEADFKDILGIFDREPNPVKPESVKIEDSGIQGQRGLEIEESCIVASNRSKLTGNVSVSLNPSILPNFDRDDDDKSCIDEG